MEDLCQSEDHSKVWLLLQPEFVVAGTQLLNEGQTVTLHFDSSLKLSRVFIDHLKSGGSHFVQKFGIFVKQFAPPAQCSYSSSAVVEVYQPFGLKYALSKSTLLSVSGSMLTEMA